MGLFASKPEDLSEWAGLPSEPLDPPSESELLGAAPAADLLGGAPTESVQIEMPSAD